MRNTKALFLAVLLLALGGLGASIAGLALPSRIAAGAAGLAALLGLLLPGRPGPGREGSEGEVLAEAARPSKLADPAPEAPAPEAGGEEELEILGPEDLRDLAVIGDARERVRFARAIAAMVPNLTEEATFALIERFQSMRGNSSRAANSARDFKAALGEGGGSGRAPVAVQAERTRKVIKTQRESIGAMTEGNRKGAKELRAMGTELESGMGLLKGIEEITERSRLIAFNMAVEAARIGEKGRGFRVIVGELRKLNDQTADFSRQVGELLRRFRDYNESVVARLAEETEKVARDVSAGMESAEEAVESLIGASAAADRFARDIAALVETIDSDLDGVLESLQFQDITRQMIEGSLAIMDESEADLVAALRKLGILETAEGDLARREGMRKDYLARSKTKGEKQALMEARR